MAKYLWQASYSTDGIKGVMKEGGTSRRATVEQIVKELGGTVEAFYFAFGEDDVYVIVDLPDNKTAAAISMTVGASGAVSVKTTALLTPEDIDDAAQISVAYRPPGA